MKTAKTISGGGALDGNYPLNSIIFVKESKTIKESGALGRCCSLFPNIPYPHFSRKSF